MGFANLRFLLLAIGFAAFASARVEAMTLVVQSGEVLVNRGDGFQVVTGSVEIGPGSTVVVKECAAAQFLCSGSGSMALAPGYHPVPSECAPAGPQVFELDTAGYLLIGAGVLGGAAAIIAATGDNDKPASGQ